MAETVKKAESLGTEQATCHQTVDSPAACQGQTSHTPPVLRRLAADKYHLGPFGTVRASLWAVTVTADDRESPLATVFALRIVGCGKQLFCRMGYEEAFARDLYRRLVAGRVSPSAIREILACELPETK